MWEAGKNKGREGSAEKLHDFADMWFQYFFIFLFLCLSSCVDRKFDRLPPRGGVRERKRYVFLAALGAWCVLVALKSHLAQTFVFMFCFRVFFVVSALGRRARCLCVPWRPFLIFFNLLVQCWRCLLFFVGAFCVFFQV